MDTSPSSVPGGDEPSARADLVAAALWISFGAAVATGAWRMDRLERLNINPYEAPGLVPGLLGVLTFAFVTVFVGLLDRERQVTLGRSVAGQWLRAGVYGAAWSAIVTLSFQHIFLVRLP